jgi:type III restriction enzyme
MQLKPYQSRALHLLRVFLERCRAGSFADAYAATLAHIAEAGDGDPAAGDCAAEYARGAGYTAVEGLDAEAPYCCIRLPTGGGKTLLAAHAVKVAADAYLERSRVPVLWLVPSGAIQEQTVEALKQPRHPYRRALEEAFGDVAVFDIDERRQIAPQDFADKTVVIVGTMQTFRVTDTSQRLVYGTDENLERHFRDVRMSEGLEIEESGPRKGDVKFSFANLLYRHRPLLILDEAHNFMTGLSAQVKQRLRPAAIIEFTATPKPRSNVISAATAQELKTAEMIKMPIHLTQHGSWQQAVNGAVMQRTKLAAIGAADPGRIRPIVLYQAQPATEGAEATVEKLKAHLIEVERIDSKAIRVATGDQRELDGVDLFDPACPVEHVITVQALKEGWDCSFAYIFCSLASISSGVAVEQLLGRVLRMPFAQRRASEELNRAYAHVSEANFAAAAQGLQDKLTEMGFDERQARAAIIETPPELELGGGGPLFSRPRPPVHRVPSRPDIARWSPEAQRATRMADDGSGGVTLIVAADAPEEVQREVARAIEPMAPGSVASVERYLEQALAARSPAERGVSFAVPRLSLHVQGELDLAEPESFIDLAGWDLLGDPADARLDSFNYTETGEGFAFDVEGDTLVYRNIEEEIALALDERTEWDAAALSRFIDANTRQVHTAQPVYLEFCRRIVADLIERRRMSLAALVRGKFALRKAVVKHVEELRARTARRGVQMFLDGQGAPDFAQAPPFAFAPTFYNVTSFHDGGGFRAKRHFYARIGKMNGFEVRCATVIDRLPEVETWVRNGDRAPGNYALARSTGHFFPDFVAKLHDGRVFLIEAKGRTDEADREKDNVGRRVMEASGGRLLYVTVSEAEEGRRDIEAQIRAVLSV